MNGQATNSIIDIKVLIVDDNEVLRNELRYNLELDYGFIVQAAASGEAALEFVRKAAGDLDAVLLDRCWAESADLTQ